MSIVIFPRVSEKAYGLATDKNTYVFNVPLTANKSEIQTEVESLYSVKVETINIVRMKGKIKRSVKKGGRQVYGKRADFKKAYVVVAKGQTIPVFAAKEGEK